MAKENLKKAPAAEAAAGAAIEVKTDVDYTVTIEALTAGNVELQKSLEAAETHIANIEAEAEVKQRIIDRLTADLKAANESVFALQEQLAALPQPPVRVIPEESSAALHEFFEHLGRKYAFTAKAPERISIDDRVYTQAELLNHEEHMTSLIVGESAFIKQVFD